MAATRPVPVAPRRARGVPVRRAAAGHHTHGVRGHRDPPQRRPATGRPGARGAASVDRLSAQRETAGRPGRQPPRRVARADAALAAITNEGRRAGRRRRLDAVHGPGLVVTLDDAQRDAEGRFPGDASADDLVVHQQDIVAVLNALWSAAPRASRCRTSGSSPRRCRGASATRCCSTAGPTARPTS